MKISLKMQVCIQFCMLLSIVRCTVLSAADEGGIPSKAIDFHEKSK